MGGRGAISASAKSNERYYSDQRAGFARIAEQAEKSSSGSFRNIAIAGTARAAEELVGTERAADLLSNTNLNKIYRDMSREFDVIGASVLVDLDKMLNNETLNKPLGSSLSNDEWQEVKDRVQAAHSFLVSDGYTDYEIAAALAYGRYLIRRT